MDNDKRIERLRRQVHNVMPEEVKDALLGEGFELKRIRGSHWVYLHRLLERSLTIPYHRPLKTPYVRQALSAIEEVRRLENR